MKPEGHAMLRRQECAAVRRSANRPLPVGVQQVMAEHHQPPAIKCHPARKVDEAAHKMMCRHIGDRDRGVVARSAPIFGAPHLEFAVLVGLAHREGRGEEGVAGGRLIDDVDVLVVGDRCLADAVQPLRRARGSDDSAQPLLGDELEEEFLGVLVDPGRVGPAHADGGAPIVAGAESVRRVIDGVPGVDVEDNGVLEDVGAATALAVVAVAGSIRRICSVTSAVDGLPPGGVTIKAAENSASAVLSASVISMPGPATPSTHRRAPPPRHSGCWPPPKEAPAALAPAVRPCLLAASAGELCAASAGGGVEMPWRRAEAKRKSLRRSRRCCSGVRRLRMLLHTRVCFTTLTSELQDYPT